ncbi:hypothetical protein HPB51_004645 [Rhipicephalus microplus]|uniref:Uncharacterized protein n=1 Tax=Rhipicephalus microplus TaxID=6941 RepID=A0A9J6EFA1_RHIMP|nr:hypothetical protein HPB51_004645 [Rhipicephalus microplus]
MDLWPRPTLATSLWAAARTSPSPYKKALLGKPATTTATTEHQQPQASGTSKAKTVSREVSWEQSPGQLNSPKPSPKSPSHPSSPLNTNYDAFPEIAKLRRDMEARHAQMHVQLKSAIECTNARIQAAIESARQESLALKQISSQELSKAAMPSYNPGLQEAILRWAEVLGEAYRE